VFYFLILPSVSPRVIVIMYHLVSTPETFEVSNKNRGFTRLNITKNTIGSLNIIFGRLCHHQEIQEGDTSRLYLLMMPCSAENYIESISSKTSAGG
jgi:hypothetical protein